jgi:hypothetical protein
MKYLITESRLENLIYKYLESKGLYLLSTVNTHHFFYSRKSIDDGEYPIISYDNKRKDCFVSSDLVGEISSLFSIDPEYSLKVISEWVGNKLDVEIESYNSDFGAD